MIINIERNSELSLYYIGSIIIDWLMKENVISIESLLRRVVNSYGNEIHVDFVYYALDWLYLMSLVKIEEGNVYYDNQKTNST